MVNPHITVSYVKYMIFGKDGLLMLVSNRFVIIAWIMAILLLANSFIIMINIFDFPVTGIRHLISFISALGIVTGLIFIMLGISQFLGLTKRG